MIIARSKILLLGSIFAISLLNSASSKSIIANADSDRVDRSISVDSSENNNSNFIEETSADIEEEVSTESNLASLGEFKITVYDACEYCSGEWGTQLARPCSDGHSAIENHTVAVDPDIIPYGTKLLIDGVEYVAEDCGGAVKGNVIDVYVEDCENSFGRKYSEVFIIE